MEVKRRERERERERESNNNEAPPPKNTQFPQNTLHHGRGGDKNQTPGPQNLKPKLPQQNPRKKKF
jgi:hypothetical protein